MPPGDEVAAACKEDEHYRRYYAACEERYGRYLKVFELFRDPDRRLERAHEDALGGGRHAVRREVVMRVLWRFVRWLFRAVSRFM